MSDADAVIDRFLCVGVDIQSYSSRGIWGQEDLQTQLQSALQGAAVDARLDRLKWLTQEQGDGELALVPAGPDERRVIGELVRYLDARLERLNSIRNPEARIRLRIAFHNGWAKVAPMGYAGEAVIAVARLLQADQLKQALAAAPRANLGVITSATAFDTVRQGLTILPHDEFVEVLVQVKEYASPAWIWIPGRDVVMTEPAPPPPPDAREPRSTAGPDFRGATIHGSQVFGDMAGDIVTHHHHGPPPRDHRVDGMALLRQRCYPEAAAEFRKCLRGGDADTDIHYYLALAQLGGRPPRDHHDVSQVIAHLKAASALAEARLLWLIVDEDHRPGRRNNAVPNPLMFDLVERIAPERAAEIIGQFSAVNSPTWQALTRRAHSR